MRYLRHSEENKYVQDYIKRWYKTGCPGYKSNTYLHETMISLLCISFGRQDCRYEWSTHSLGDDLMSKDKKKRRVLHSNNLILFPCFGKWHHHESSCLRQKKIDLIQNISLLSISHNNHLPSFILVTFLLFQKICPTPLS